MQKIGFSGRMENKPGSSQNRSGHEFGVSASDYQEEDVIEPLSNCPFFYVILTKSCVKNLYHLVVPAKFHGNLPSHVTRAVLTYHGKTWEMACGASEPYCRRFTSGWKKFILDNNLKVGDACVFELIHRDYDMARFKVQILRGDFPNELLDKIDSTGDSSDNPILI